MLRNPTCKFLVSARSVTTLPDFLYLHIRPDWYELHTCQVVGTLQEQCDAKLGLAEASDVGARSKRGFQMSMRLAFASTHLMRADCYNAGTLVYNGSGLPLACI